MSRKYNHDRCVLREPVTQLFQSPGTQASSTDKDISANFNTHQRGCLCPPLRTCTLLSDPTSIHLAIKKQQQQTKGKSQERAPNGASLQVLLSSISAVTRGLHQKNTKKTKRRKPNNCPFPLLPKLSRNLPFSFRHLPGLGSLPGLLPSSLSQLIACSTTTLPSKVSRPLRPLR